MRARKLSSASPPSSATATTTTTTTTTTGYMGDRALVYVYLWTALMIVCITVLHGERSSEKDALRQRIAAAMTRRAIALILVSFSLYACAVLRVQCKSALAS